MSAQQGSPVGCQAFKGGAGADSGADSIALRAMETCSARIELHTVFAATPVSSHWKTVLVKDI
jgi:hypothetical protein